jgi:hypothetical protein
MLLTFLHLIHFLSQIDNQLSTQGLITRALFQSKKLSTEYIHRMIYTQNYYKFSIITVRRNSRKAVLLHVYKGRRSKNVQRTSQTQHENSLKKHITTTTTMCIYTDGSGIQNHIDASAYSLTAQSTAHSYLGKDDITNIYAAELTGVHLGIKMAGTSPPQYDKCVIYVDNQASIQAINTPKQ